mgnify:CR=1 FL=1
MKKIIILEIDENGDVSIMDKNKVKLSKTLLKEIADTYKKLGISEDDEDTNQDFNEIFRYDYSKKSSLDINSYANI